MKLIKQDEIFDLVLQIQDTLGIRVLGWTNDGDAIELEFDRDISSTLDEVKNVIRSKFANKYRIKEMRGT